MTSPIFVITGSNKGIGRALVEKLMKAAPPSSLIYLTSRNPDLGQQTLQEIQQSSQSSKSQLAYHQLDVSDQKSIQDFASYIKRQHPNKIDVLVNNAGIATKGSAFDADIVSDGVFEPFLGCRCISDWMVTQVRNTLHTNFYGLKSMCEHFVPVRSLHAVPIKGSESSHMRFGPALQLIKDGGRIVNVSSMAGKTRSLKSEELKAKFHDPKASVDDIVKLMQKFQVCGDERQGTCSSARVRSGIQY